MKIIAFLISCLLMVITTGVTDAQLVPKYQYTNWYGPTYANGADFHSPGAHKHQWIYRPSELPGLPAGPINSVYFRVGITYGPVTTHNPTIYDSMRVKMGYTQDTSYKDTLLHGYPYYLFKTGLTQVFFQPKVTIWGADSVGTWVRFPIDGFSYNPNANLVVELSRTAIGDNRTNYGFDWMANRGCYGCFLAGVYDSTSSSNWPFAFQADIGFDDATGAVGGLVNLKGFYAYPNPSQGLFTVGFEPFGGHVSTVQMSVSDMAGRQVWQHRYQDVRADLFTANVDLRDRPKGIYLLRVQAGEAQAMQRVMLE